MENIDIDKLTPMMKIYCETKEQYKDCILFYRLGDFYEMFFDDALTASRELEITLTGKSCGLDEQCPDVRNPIPCRRRLLEPSCCEGIQSRNL